MTRRAATLAAAALVAALGGACGGDDAAEHDRSPTVTITENGYDPAELTIEAGDRVTFVNRSKERPQSAKDDPTGDIEVSPQPGSTAHDGSEVNRATREGFATHALFTGERQTVIFPVPHEYEYSSAFDPGIEGTIEVVPKDR